MFTLCGSVFCGQDFFGGVQGNLTEEKGHREDHPDINHLDVRSGGEGLRDSSETENEYWSNISVIALSVSY